MLALFFAKTAVRIMEATIPLWELVEAVPRRWRELVEREGLVRDW